MKKLEIRYQRPDVLKPHKRNPRTHSPQQIEQIAASIRRFGFTNPIIVDENNRIMAGHGRVAAAVLLEMAEVPTVYLADMSEADIRAYVIADNRLAENAGWDIELLGSELEYISGLDADLDLTITGFSVPEIDNLICGVVSPDDGVADPADAVPEAEPTQTVTRLGDVWNIGDHRLVCGDATGPEAYTSLLDGELAEMVFCDPPYNVPIDGHVSGLGKTQHREFAMASGEMSNSQFTAFLAASFDQLAAFSGDGSIHYQCIDWRHLPEMLAAGQKAYTELKNLCVWAKTNGGMGSLYRSQHELVLVFKSGTAKHINNVDLGRHGRYRTNVWTYPGANAFGANRDGLDLHPTVKPVALVADAIRDCSNRRGIVLDAFAGSGTTLVAAERTGRRGRGIEIDPIYCDVIIRRMRDVFGLHAVLQNTGQDFTDVGATRLREEQLGENKPVADGVTT